MWWEKDSPGHSWLWIWERGLNPGEERASRSWKRQENEFSLKLVICSLDKILHLTRVIEQNNGRDVAGTVWNPWMVLFCLDQSRVFRGPLSYLGVLAGTKEPPALPPWTSRGLHNPSCFLFSMYTGSLVWDTICYSLTSDSSLTSFLGS